MMFGGVGQPRSRRFDPDHPPRARRRDQLHRHRRRLLAGESEEIVGKALAGGRRDVSCSRPRSTAPMGEDPNQRGNSRRWIMREVENSLRRLKTDWIDLYQIHRPEPTPTSRRRSAR
jgi:aryl-alcohol dehydrogenase-like predicted oxidoreductase